MATATRGRADYQDRKDARVDRLRERADKQMDNAKSQRQTADSISERFYMGQPILVGHHSEGKARRDQSRMHDNMRKSFEHEDKAKHLNQRAASAESNKAISQDDPEAVVKLREKLAGLEKEQQLMKAGNKVYRSKKLTDEEKVKQLVDLGLSERAAIAGLSPDFAGRIGFASYLLTNNNANMKRIKDRIKSMLINDSMNFEDITINDIDIIDDQDDNRIKMFFPGKPEQEVRAMLKRHGFRWSRTSGAWQAYRNYRSYSYAKEIATGI